MNEESGVSRSHPLRNGGSVNGGGNKKGQRYWLQDSRCLGQVRSRIVKELVSARLDQEISKIELSTRIGLDTRKYHNNTLFKWETELHVPSLTNIERWARGLGYELTLRKIEGEV